MDALLASGRDGRAWLEVSPDERKEAHSLDFPAERQSLSCMRDANLLAGRHPPAMRGLSGRRGAERKDGSRENGRGKTARESLAPTALLEEEVPEMRKRTAGATESMRLRSRLFLNADWLRRGANGFDVSESEPPVFGGMCHQLIRFLGRLVNGPFDDVILRRSREPVPLMGRSARLENSYVFSA